MDEPSRSRRRFLKSAGAGVAALAGAGAIGAAERSASPPAAGKRRKRFRLGLTTYMFKHYDLDKTLQIARRVAVDLICLRSNLLPLEATGEQVTAALRKVRQAGLEVYGGGVIYMRNERAVERAFAHAKAAGYRLISASIAPKLLPLVDRKVKASGLRIAIHNHGPEDRAYPTPVAIYEKVKPFDRRIGICHDTGHTLRAGMDPTEATRKTADRTFDLHLKDVDAAKAGGHSTELGRGVMDIPAFLRMLREIGYGGIVGIEYEKHMEDLLPGLAESVGYARGVLDVIERED